MAWWRVLIVLILLTVIPDRKGNAQDRTKATDSCFSYTTHDGHRRSIRIERRHDSLYVVRHAEGHALLSEWKLPWPVYRFDCGDLTGDGIPEIAVGVVKGTRHFPAPDKRLLLFKLYRGRLIRPLWMGSRLARPLEDFRVVRDSMPARILTTEKAGPDGKRVQALYRQEGFGLKYERTL